MKSSKKSWKRFGNKIETSKHECFYCGVTLNDWNRTVDHIVPKSKGGILSNDNKVWCCKRCNQFKADTDVFQFKEMVTFLLNELNRDHENKIGYYVRLRKRLAKLIASQHGKEKTINIKTTEDSTDSTPRQLKGN